MAPKLVSSVLDQAGMTVDQALANAREAIQLHVECLEADGLAVPEENGSLVTSVIAIAA